MNGHAMTKRVILNIDANRLAAKNKIELIVYLM